MGLIPSAEIPELLRRHGGLVDEHKRILQMRMGLGEQRRQARRRKLRRGNGEGVEGRDLLATIRLKFFVIGNEASQMNDGRMEGKITGFVEAQLAPDGLFNLHGHAPEANVFGTYFGKIASDVGLLYLGE